MGLKYTPPVSPLPLSMAAPSLQFSKPPHPNSHPLEVQALLHRADTLFKEVYDFLGSEDCFNREKAENFVIQLTVLLRNFRDYFSPPRILGSAMENRMTDMGNFITRLRVLYPQFYKFYTTNS